MKIRLSPQVNRERCGLNHITNIQNVF